MNSRVVSYEDWLNEREALLEKEKAWTRMRDEISAERQAMSMVLIEKEYEFATESGQKTLADLFGNQSQLLIYHFMFGAGWQSTCEGCTAWADALNGTTSGFKAADARLIVSSNAPLDQLLAEKSRRNWSFDWVSAFGSDFGQDFHASSAANQESKQVGSQTVSFDRGENHAISALYKDDDGKIFLTYSCFNRGVEPMNGAFAYYDILKKGRQW